MEAYLFVDGRRGDVLKKIITFKSGDPTLISPVGQVALKVQPAEIVMDILPGGTRSMSVLVINGSEEEVKVQAETILPENMKAATTGTGTPGEELGCDQWVTLAPKEFSLKGHVQRSVSVLARMPKEATKHRDYYATLRLHVSYADGKSAGTRDALICVQNKKVADQPTVAAPVLTIAEMSPSRYMASASFINTGATHANGLTCQGMLNLIGAGGGGASILTRFLMTSEAFGQTGILLPIEARSFSGVLDISNVPAGDYFVTTVLRWPEGPADGVQKQITIHVSDEGGRKVARMVDLAGVAPQLIRL